MNEEREGNQDQVELNSSSTNATITLSPFRNPSAMSIPLHLIDNSYAILSSEGSTRSHCAQRKTSSTIRSSSSCNRHIFSYPKRQSATTTSQFQLAFVVTIALFTIFYLPHPTDAIAVHKGSQATIASLSSSSSSSSNALTLLNTARFLRERKLSSSPSFKIDHHVSIQKGQLQKQQQPLQHPSHSLPELLRRTQNSKIKMSSTTISSSRQHKLITKTPSSWTYALFDDDDNNNELLSAAIHQKEEEEFISHRIQKQLPSVKKLLQTSYGNDVPDMELHLQMEAARARGKHCSSVAALSFMDLHHGFSGDGTTSWSSASVTHSKGTSAQNDKINRVNAFASMSGNSHNKMVSTIEKFAMSSLPIQLPGLAAPVMNGSSGGRRAPRSEITVKKKSKLTSKARRTALMKKVSSAAATTTETKPMKTTKQRKKKMRTSTGDTIIIESNKEDETSTKVKKSQLDAIKQNTSSMKKIQTKQVSNIMTARKTLSESSSTARVSHDEEIQLARIIQRGAELHSIKSEFEKENEKDITRQEWAELAKLDSPKELRRLVSDYRKAKNKLVMANMGLVHAVVRSRMRESGQGSVSFDGISYEEMVQEGSLGLLRAAELFDPCRGLRFSTYATIWIKGTLGNNSLSEAITLPLREKNKWKKIQHAIEDIGAEKGADEDGVDYKPSEEEIGSRCGFDETEVKAVMTKMKLAKNVLSLDYQYVSTSRSGTESGGFDALSNDKNLMDDVDLVERLQLRADIVAALTRNLDPREARLMRLRYGLNDGKTRSISGCAEAMGISKARAQQLAVGCLKKLREADDAESLQEYLLSVA